jgi:hypothetical protein
MQSIQRGVKRPVSYLQDMFTIISMSRDLLTTAIPANPVVCIREDKIQSRNLVFPVFMIIGKRTTDNLATSAEVFNFFLALESDATGIDLDVKPFDTHVSSDMSTAWKTTGLGGGAQGNVQFCTYPPVRSSRMHLPRDEPCPDFFEMYAYQCYHHGFVNPAAMTVYTDYMNELAADIEKGVDYPTVCAHSTIEFTDPLLATEGELNPH